MDGGSPQLLRIEVLGPLRAWRGRTPLDPGPVKRQAVLAALLLRQGAVASHAQLLDAVWGTEPPAGGRKVLPTHVNSLRRVLDTQGTQPANSLIRSGKGWYRFVVEQVRLDTADLAQRSDEAMRTLASGDLATAADQLSAALGLFQGEPLANLPGPFAQDERQRLWERRRTLRLERLKCLVLLRRFGDALDDLAGPSGPSSSDRYDESLLALRMRALYGCERQAEALNAYEDMRVRLRDDLGVDPGEELRRVYEAVLRQDDAFLLPAPAPPRTRAPTSSCATIGRLPSRRDQGRRGGRLAHHATAPRRNCRTMPRDSPAVTTNSPDCTRSSRPSRARGRRTPWSSPPSAAPRASARPRWRCTGRTRYGIASRTGSCM